MIIISERQIPRTPLSFHLHTEGIHPVRGDEIEFPAIFVRISNCLPRTQDSISRTCNTLAYLTDTTCSSEDFTFGALKCTHYKQRSYQEQRHSKQDPSESDQRLTVEQATTPALSMKSANNNFVVCLISQSILLNLNIQNSYQR